MLAMLAITQSPLLAAEAEEGLVPSIGDIHWFWYIAPVGAIVALVFAVKFYKEVKAANPGDEKMIAIAGHVTGQPGMSTLSKIIFIADYLEPGREYLQRNSGASLIGEADLDELLLFVLKQILDHRRRKGKMIVEPALRLFDELTHNKFRLKGEYN